MSLLLVYYTRNTIPHTQMESFDWVACARRLKAGDHRALEMLYRRCCAELTAYARFRLDHAHEADDVVQDTFIRLWENRRNIDPDRSLRALLFVSVRNRVANRERDRKPAVSMTASILQTIDGQAEPVSDLPETESLETLLERWMAELPERRQEAFRLSRLDDLRYADIAEVMGISIKTVENHIGEALRFLRDKIRRHDPELLNKS
jgi:RNA polymerase sigma-70 factor, ECF subfamily